MASFIIEGGHRLHGELIPQGAKNEALEVLCATLLTPEEVKIYNIPDILDVNNLIQLLRDLGVTVERIGLNAYSFKADKINLDYLNSDEFFQKGAALRGSVMIIGPLLARFGYAVLPKPGGDKIGRRRLDTHFLGIQKLGATFTYCPKAQRYEIKADKLTGSYMLLDEASVTGTANILMAAVLAEGDTTIYNAACEPYLQQLSKMLNRMGARIEGIGSNLLTIHGVSSLKGCEHTILPDMIEVGSFIGMAAMTQSDITIKNVSYNDLGIIPDSFRRLGITVEQNGDDIHIPEHESYEIDTFIDGSIMTFADAPWPGLTPDLLSVFLVVATQAKGSVLIHQKMFESRLFFVDKLIDMGAQIILCDPHRAAVIGQARAHKLRAANMVSPDIRAGIALLIAAMSAEGTSRIHNIDQIDRGYQEIDKRLNAMIEREELIKIGRFNKPHGVKGELSFTFTDDVFDRTDCPYIVCEIDGIFVPFFIEEYRFKSDTTALMKLEDVDNETDARAFSLLDVYFPKSYYDTAVEEEAPSDYFIGFTVVDSERGELGKIVAVDDSTENVLFEIDHEGRELLVPAVDEFVSEIDEENRRLYMTIPEGLLTL